jgi:HEPN domain-containing protein
MGDSSVARMLLDAARDDAKAVEALIGLPDIADGIVGFHAQQAVEKALKSVLSHHGVAFRRTHDLAELLDLLADQGLDLPPHFGKLDQLNPFAVEARYGLIGRLALARDGLTQTVADVLAWATDLLDAPGT